MRKYAREKRQTCRASRWPRRPASGTRSSNGRNSNGRRIHASRHCIFVINIERNRAGQNLRENQCDRLPHERGVHQGLAQSLGEIREVEQGLRDILVRIPRQACLLKHTCMQCRSTRRTCNRTRAKSKYLTPAVCVSVGSNKTLGSSSTDRDAIALIAIRSAPNSREQGINFFLMLR